MWGGYTSEVHHPDPGVDLQQCDPDPPVDDGLPDGWTPKDEDDWDPDEDDEDEDPPKCEKCDGEGKYILFQFEHTCDACGGSGY